MTLQSLPSSTTTTIHNGFSSLPRSPSLTLWTSLSMTLWHTRLHQFIIAAQDQSRLMVARSLAEHPLFQQNWLNIKANCHWSRKQMLHQWPAVTACVNMRIIKAAEQKYFFLHFEKDPEKEIERVKEKDRLITSLWGHWGLKSPPKKKKNTPTTRTWRTKLAFFLSLPLTHVYTFACRLRTKSVSSKSPKSCEKTDYGRQWAEEEVKEKD